MALIVIEVVTLSSGRSLQQEPHVVEGVDGDADLAHLALGARVVGVVPHLGREVEGARQAGLTGAQEELEPLVGGLGRPKPGVLAHGPQPAAVHVGMDPAGIRIAPGLTEPLGRLPSLERLGSVDRPDLDARVGAVLAFRCRRFGHEPQAKSLEEGLVAGAP